MSVKPLVIFDLGNTLVLYNDIPLNWSSHYENALKYAFENINYIPTNSDIDISIEILKFYNTRINYREFELQESQVFNQISKCLKCTNIELEYHFFKYFQRNTTVEPTAIKTLKVLKDKGFNICVFTDVPYSMPIKFVKNDLQPITQYLNKIYTSCNVGYRKPHIKCLQAIISDFDADLCQTYYIGDEEKDIQCANACNITSIKYGFNETESNPNYTINSIQEILKIV